MHFNFRHDALITELAEAYHSLLTLEKGGKLIGGK